jgi:hypothetical protein
MKISELPIIFTSKIGKTLRFYRMRTRPKILLQTQLALDSFEKTRYLSAICKVTLPPALTSPCGWSERPKTVAVFRLYIGCAAVAMESLCVLRAKQIIPYACFALWSICPQDEKLAAKSADFHWRE